MTATDKLIAALEIEVKLLPSSKADAGALILDRAKKFYYHDFKSPLGAPKMQLVSDLNQIGMQTLANRVVRGDFDDIDPEDTGRKRSY